VRQHLGRSGPLFRASSAKMVAGSEPPPSRNVAGGASMLISCASLLITGRIDLGLKPILTMIIAAQLRAAQALLGIDQQTLDDMEAVSLHSIQRMEASQGSVRGVVDTLTKVVEALNAAGIELLGENATSDGGGRGVGFKEPAAITQQRPLPSAPRAKKGRATARIK